MKKKVIVIVFTALLAISSVILFPTITGKQTDKGKYPPTRTIPIGVVSSSWPGFVSNEDLFSKVIAPEINEYLGQLPGSAPPLQVDFLLVGPDEDEYWYTPERHLEEIQALAEDGVEFFIAGGWSSQFGAALEYIDQNDLFMVSSSSTAPSLAIEDNGFRLTPPDTNQATVLNQMLRTYDEGIEALVVILRDDIWANGLVDALAEVYAGEIVAFAYSPESSDFPLIDAELAAQGLVGEYGADRVGILMVAFDEGADILQQAAAYGTLYNLPWFGTESAGRSVIILENAGMEACHVHFVSALGAPPDSVKYNDLAVRWAQFGHGESSFYTATAVDAAWLIVNSYLDMKASTNSPINGADMAAIFSDTAYDYYGYSGWTLLDEYGDRTVIDHDIWGFGPDPDTGEPSIINYGRFDGVSGLLTWGYEPRPWEASDCVAP